MTKKNKSKYLILKKILNMFKNIILSIEMSWNASRPLFFLRILLEITLAVLPILLAYLMKIMLNFLSAKTFKNVEVNIDMFIKVIIFYFLLQLANIVLEKIKDFCAQKHQDIINNNIDLKIINKVNTLDISYFDNPKFNDELINAANDSRALQDLTWTVIGLVRSTVSALACLFILSYLNPLIPIIIVVLTLPSMIIEKRYIKKNYSWQRNFVCKQRKMNYVKNILFARNFANEIRVLQLKEYFTNEFTHYWREWFKEKSKIAFFRSLFSSISMILPQIASTLILVYVGIKVLSNSLTIGDFTFYSGMITQFSSGVNSVFSALTKIYEYEMKLTNFSNFLTWKPIMGTNGRLKVNSPMTIEFKNVSFKYPKTDRYILKNINFKIAKSEKIALVGLNGAGKTTIIMLMIRLYDPTQGTILINDIDIREYDINDLRKSFGIVFQDFCRYALKLRENVAISDVKSIEDDNVIYSACHSAGLEKLLSRFPDGLDTYLTKQFDMNGQELSGGEWQKIAIARAFLHPSKCVIMDEPTSALDPEAEYAMFEALSNICKGKIAVFISHRLSSVTIADRILVLKNGEIIESGHHLKLLKDNKYYARLFNMQAERYVSKKDVSGGIL